MESEYSYQADSIEVAQPLLNIHGLPGLGGINLEHLSSGPLKPIETREVFRRDSDSADTQPAPPTLAQLRYWWWMRERNLLVDSSRYMEPRSGDLSKNFTSLEVDGVHLPERQIRQLNNDWLTLILLLVIVLFASVRTSWNKYLGQLFHSVVNESTSYRLFQEKNSSMLLGAFQLDIVFYFVFSAFVYQLINYYQLDFLYHNFFLYLTSLIFVVAYFTLKKFLYRFIGFLFEQPVDTEEYVYNMGNFNRITGILLIPVVILIAFSPIRPVGIIIFLGIFIVFMLYFLLILRGFITLFRKQFSIFYLFLYFCTLEFLPLVLLYKVLIV
ncbi:MAG: DUF4271 domain-containing protein [Mariniphaga sp.]|nr:DUF4271 domain-containing protein [Mariniphaga sp.]MDD4225201.1 DUF4271 domain-containing protein [Mariniphaga sp.]MDD4424554.1 DUF4271 domain-containing protein [Mariniphaga sp.]